MIKINARKILLTPMRYVGKEERILIKDLAFGRKDYKLKAYITEKGFYRREDVVLRGGVFLICGERQREENDGEDEEMLYYTKLLGQKIYDEEGEILGRIGDVEVDVQKGILRGIHLSLGIWHDLCFGREWLDGVHLENMQKEWEEWA